MPGKRHANDNSVADERRSATTSCAGVAWDERNLAPASPLPLGWWGAARAAAASRGRAPGAIPARGLRARRNRRVMPWTERAIDADLTRACRAFAAAVQAGRAPVSGPAASFFASLESYE